MGLPILALDGCRACGGRSLSLQCNTMTPAQIIVLATPVFFVLIALEWVWSETRGRPTYRLPDAINSVGLGMISQLAGLFTQVVGLAGYAAVYQWAGPSASAEWWFTLPGWLLALVLYDLCYYWLHRAGHRVGVLWAAHAVHHQSEDYNLSTALRQTSSGAVLGWLFYLPMAVLGVPPLVLGVVALIDLLYQFWVHTGQVGRLGWFDRWFCSPSNHRVHHAVNDAYLDRNYGGIFMGWDHLFGTFKEEDPAQLCVYGTRHPLRSWDPLWANLAVYAQLAHDSWHAHAWRDKVQVWFRPPGWRAPDVARRFPQPHFQLAAVQRYDTPLSALQTGVAVFGFGLILMGVALVLWHAHQMPLASLAAAAIGVSAGLWLLGAYVQGRFSQPTVVLVLLALVSTLSSALQWDAVHGLAKPLVMLFAIYYVATNSYIKSDGAIFYSEKNALIAALLGSLAGDVLLLLPGQFVGGLVCFLLAHVAYVRALTRRAPWMPWRGALAGVALAGLCMVVVLWQGGLPPALRLPVCAYVVVISLMGAQSLGRARLLNDPAAWRVAAGALCFMVSDSVLAYNRFVSPLPAAQLLVLSTYYAAQILLVSSLLYRPVALVGPK
jgi:alkylglycerol monooxygenase